MKNKITALLCAAILAASFTAGCSGTGSQDGDGAATETAAAGEESNNTGQISETDASQEPQTDAALEDGTYTADFDTDSSMFHVNEANEGKGTLTVQDGEMSIHISLVSKKIVNLFPGLAADAEKDSAEILEPTEDTVTYSDGMTEDVYGFDVPVPALDEEFDLAILGEKGTWYDHKVSVSNPEKVE